jgi:hypothetical protein
MFNIDGDVKDMPDLKQHVRFLLRELEDAKTLRDKQDKAYKDSVNQREKDIFSSEDLAGEDFMVWEPQGFGSKLKAMWFNMLEAFVLIIMTFLCLM